MGWRREQRAGHCQSRLRCCRAVVDHRSRDRDAACLPGGRCSSCAGDGRTTRRDGSTPRHVGEDDRSRTNAVLLLRAACRPPTAATPSTLHCPRGWPRGGRTTSAYPREAEAAPRRRAPHCPHSAPHTLDGSSKVKPTPRLASCRLATVCCSLPTSRLAPNRGGTCHYYCTVPE
jgi:hypothetical protein